MRIRLLAVAALVALAIGVGCGGGSSAPSVDAGSGGAGQDGGTGSGGGNADAGSGGNAGSDAGSGGSGSADAGIGSDAGGGTVGSDGGIDGGDGGTTVSECDGLMPAPGAMPLQIAVPAGSCGASAMADESGNVAFGGTGDGMISWSTYDSHGKLLGGFHSSFGAVTRSSGFQAADVWNGAGAPMDMWHFWTRKPDGSAEGQSTSVGSDACGVGTSPSSAGGAIVLSTCGSRTGDSRVIRFDDAGTQLYSTFVHAFPPTAARGDVSGNVLVVAMGNAVAGSFASDDLVGRWLDASGSLTSDWFVITKGGGSRVSLRSLIGGGIAVMRDGEWRAIVEPSVGVLAPPEWLNSRAGLDLHIVRGRKAYAFTANDGGAEVEVTTPTGSSCGKFSVQGGSVSIGADGTVMTMTAAGCTRFAYPRLLGVR